MYETHVITAEEYEAELLWLEEVFRVEKMSGVLFSGKADAYRKVLQEYLLTH